MVTKNQLV